MSKYTQIREKEPELFECFFAYSKEKIEEGIKKTGIAGKKIYSGGGGLYGTKEGIEKLMAFYDARSEEISRECDPQEVYDFEFNNHECSYTNDDEDAIKIIVCYFGEERSKTVKRRFGYTNIDDLFKEV